MKTICLFFEVHQPFRHRKYRFFDIGNDHYYYDDYANETIMRKIAEKSYLPTNRVLLKLAKELNGNFKVAFSLSGVAMEQFELYAPEVIDSFKELTRTGCVEFLSETYSHSLASLKDKTVFEEQVRLHDQKIFELFGQKPKVFKNTEMIYSDDIGAQVCQMGYQGMLTEGARHILGWKSPNFLYVNARNPRLKVLMRNFKLSDDISFRFSNNNWSEYPLTAEKFTGWLKKLDSNEEVVNLFLSYESFGERQPKESGIFEFLERWAQLVAEDNSLKFATPSQIIKELQPVSVVSVPNPISWADEERDLTAWLGNEMQKEAFENLYELRRRMASCTDPKLIRDWNYLQISDHFYYMSTKFFSSGEAHSYYNPFESPYEAFINYMNVLSDFKIRLNAVTPENEKEQEVAALHKLLASKEQKIKKMEAELQRLQKPKTRQKKTTKKRKA
ncbi:alpha-amylase [Mariniphaga anaerophila]|uniref:Alpha-amylase n=1 Tax=Mariniphaga anaerophila TaxID=1484053 RepID=A0A1M4YNZ9_9BACT|nr:glycoside hydrolase family 57 protein [Mariniphaga anaerophila]SHF07383.1 alpha-amylase [Mariniphaga anaerophila]